MTFEHSQPVDIAIIGGGINGTGIAARLARQGLSVLLCEQHDLASYTSSASTKLIHGGLRYLEHFEFRLVREALQERELLLNLAPHLIHPINFIMPHSTRLRSAWQIRLGLFIYDHLAKRRKLPTSTRVDLRKSKLAHALKPEFTLGFSYADCATDDARLVVANAMQAREHGAHILTRTAVTHAVRQQSYWQLTIKPQQTQARTVQAKVLINAAGPWALQLQQQFVSVAANLPAIFSKGSHIIVPKLYDDNHALLLQHTDRRIVFIIPYQHHYSLIGTTDVVCGANDDFTQLSITPAEQLYLLDAVNHYLQKPLTPAEILHSFAGVRLLLGDNENDPAAITRDYVLALDANTNAAPMLSIFGGKLTTFRRLAEKVQHKIAPLFPQHHWQELPHTPLPGGAIPHGDMPLFIQQLTQQYAWLPPALLARYASAYGSNCFRLLDQCQQLTDLGMHLGDDLYQREVAYLQAEEWACTADDILWRRSKIGLYANNTTVNNLQRCLVTAHPVERNRH